MIIVGLQHVPAAVWRVEAPNIVGGGHVARDHAAFARCGTADGEVHLSNEGVVGKNGLGVSKCRGAGQSIPDQLRVHLGAFHRDRLHQLIPQLLQRAVLPIRRKTSVHSNSPARWPKSSKAADKAGVGDAAVLRHTTTLEVHLEGHVTQDVREAHALAEIEIAGVKHAAVGGLGDNAGAKCADFVAQVGDGDYSKAGVERLRYPLHLVLVRLTEVAGYDGSQSIEFGSGGRK